MLALPLVAGTSSRLQAARDPLTTGAAAAVVIPRRFLAGLEIGAVCSWVVFFLRREGSLSSWMDIRDSATTWLICVV
jgi:hypothetical protein